MQLSGATKTLLRNSVADILRAGGVSAAWRRKNGRALVILCYHRVLPADVRNNSPFPDLAVTPEAFSKHIEFFRRHYECLPLEQAHQEFARCGRLDKPLLSITFDDGYWDNFEIARPILNTYDIRATFFVISSLVGTKEAPWYDRLARALKFVGIGNNGRSVTDAVEDAKHLDPQARAEVIKRAVTTAQEAGYDDDNADRMMTREDVARLVTEGHEVGAHTRTHPMLTQLSGDALRDELAGCRSDLESMTGQKVTSLAFPNGNFDEQVLAATRSAGYERAVSMQHGLCGQESDSFRLPRLFVSQDRLSRPTGTCSTSLLAMELAGLADRIFFRSSRGCHTT